ncbi:MAG: class B sortase, partial [Acetatifactor sp.]
MKEMFKKKKKLFIIGIIAAVIIIACLVALLAEYRQYKSELNQNVVKMEDLAVQMTINTESEAESVTEPTPEKSDVEQLKPMHDFEALKQVNEDVYAWIEVPDTQVDYPVLQSDTDNKYLDTNIDGTSGYPGCIYSNVCNSKSFDDYITVLYGHNMKSGEMFGSLHNFDDADFFQEFETYTVETEEARFTYSVYAAVNYNDKLIPAYFDVKSISGRDEFLESLELCRENSITHFNDEIEISGEDKVLVLSVCIRGQEDRRYLIVSKLE